MEKIKEFTPEQWAIVDQRTADASKIESVEITAESLRPAVDALYKLFDHEPPEHILIFESVGELSRWQCETKQEVSSDWIGIYSKIWHTHLLTALEIGALEEDAETKELQSIVQLSNQLYDSAAYQRGFCAVKLPHTCHRDESYELHCATGPAIAWSDQSVYLWHGVIVPEALIMNPESMTGEILSANTEIRRAWGERLGWARALDLLKATEVSKQTDSTTGLEYRLCSIPTGERILLKQSPPLLDKSQPVYAEQVSRECQTALGARAWQVPYAALGLPERSPADCDANPNLAYVWER